MGAIALIGSMTIAPIEASAMPVAAATAHFADAGAEPEASVEKVYWRHGWRRYGWRRPFGWRRAYGWGWRHPYRRFYRW